MRAQGKTLLVCKVATSERGAASALSHTGALAGSAAAYRAMFERVGAIEATVNAELAQDRPIHVRFLPRAEAFAIPDLIRTKVNLLPEGIEEIRIVDIEGLDLQADGGTHVHRTSEVGRIEVTGYEGIDPKAANFRSLATKIKSTGAGLVYFGGTTQSGAVMGPDERISPYVALKAVTAYPAWQIKEEKTKGTLEDGKLADLVILEQNPLKVDPKTIKDIKVLETIKEGQTVYERK